MGKFIGKLPVSTEAITNRKAAKAKAEPEVQHATLVLAVTAVLSMMIYTFIFAKIAFMPDVYNIPLLTGKQLSLHSIDQGYGYARMQLISGFMALGVLYYFAWKAAHHVRDWIDWAIVILAAFAFGAALLFMYPFGAADLFDNITHGRILAFYHGNPFANPIVQYPTDPFIPYTAWRFDVSAYGPLWELLAGVLAKLAGDNIAVNIINFKLGPALFWVLSIPVAGVMLKRANIKPALPPLLLFLWNPLMLYEVWGNGHNDMMMAFFILLAAWMVLEKRYSLAVLSLVAGGLVKYIAFLLIPIVGLMALRALPDNKRRILFILSAAALSIGLIVIAWSPFWVGIKTLTIGRREGMLSGTAASAIWSTLVDGTWRLPKDATARYITKVLGLLTVAFAIFQGYRAMRKPGFQSFINASFNVLMFYLLVTVPWFQQWYAIWVVILLPFLEPMAKRLVLVFAFAALGKQLWVDPTLYWSAVWSPLPDREIAFALGNLGVPWLYAIYTLHEVWKKRLAEARNPARAIELLALRPQPIAIPVTGEEQETGGD